MKDTKTIRQRQVRPAPLRDAFAFTLPDAEQMSGLSRSTLRRRAAEGKLTTTKVGGRRLVVAESLRRLLAAETGE